MNDEAPKSAVIRTQEVYQQLDETDVKISELQSAAGRLSDQLHSVLRDATPAVAAVSVEENQLVPLATRIRGNRYLLSDLVDTLESILDRLEV
jgi:hypothetical protein